VSGDLPKNEEIAAGKLRFVFWANFFGPAYVEQYGREFLWNAPGWRVEELEDGGILYVTTERYVDWWLAVWLDQAEEAGLTKWIRGEADRLWGLRSRILA
jgi:hypothetical protein